MFDIDLIIFMPGHVNDPCRRRKGVSSHTVTAGTNGDRSSWYAELDERATSTAAAQRTIIRASRIEHPFQVDGRALRSSLGG